MAPAKRKAVTDERPNKKVKAGDSGKKDGASPRASKSNTKSSSNEEKGIRKALPTSILQQEERAFPRGGGSVLTPLEQKQIKAQAEQDVLFEQQTGQKAPIRDDDDGGELFDDQAAAAAPPKKKRKVKSHEKGASVDTKSGIRIQSLSYKNLVVGSRVLGCVTAVTGRDVALALPNNLTGYAPLMAVSEGLSDRIEKLLENEDATEQESDIDLKRLFHVGQWLRATVAGTSTENGDSKKRHIELSLDPRQVNGGLDADDIVVNSMLQAAVKSVEDHGVIMDLGLADPSVKGFVSKKELGAGFDLDALQEGQVMMCLVTGKSSNGKVLKLSPDAARFSASSAEKSAPVVNEAPNVQSFLPGTAVQILVTDSSPGGVAGKVMGMVDVTADLIHSGATSKDMDISKKYKIGSKIKGRIIWALPNDDDGQRIGVSLLDHTLVLPPHPSKLPLAASSKLRTQSSHLERSIPLSTTVEDAKVVHVLPERGLFLSLPSSSGKALTAFAHISQVSDNRVETLSSSSGTYQLDSSHRARVLSYNPIDGLYYVSLKQSILDQAFLRIEDVKVGEVVKGTIEKLILGGKNGISGVLVKLSDSISGLVPETHLSDVHLQHPERKFREGFPVTARVLSVDLEKRHLRLTLKKTLVNDEESPIWKEYSALKPGMESKGTVVNLLPAGAAVQFFGNVRAWLPVAEMSEGYIENVSQHFRLGQTVNVRIVSINPETQEMKVSCKQDGLFGEDEQTAWNALEGGQIVSGIVTVKGGDSVTVDLANGLHGLLRLGHLADGSRDKAEGALKRIRVGQTLTDLVVLDKLERSKQVLLTNKPSLVKAAKNAKLVRSTGDVQDGADVHGFVRNVTADGVYVEFANGVVGLVPKSQVSPDAVGQPNFGLAKDETVRAWVLSVDTMRERFALSMREDENHDANLAVSKDQGTAALSQGQVVTVRIASVKATQLNVRLPNGTHGRIDVSEVFESFADIGNKKAPLQKFKANEELQAVVLGSHDAKNHRFLPISHRQSKVSVYELSAKQSRVVDRSMDLLKLEDVKLGSSYLAFVNNHSDSHVWVNISPNVRGRIALMDLSEDVGSLQNLQKGFPVGCALQVIVKNVDLGTQRLDLTAKSTTEQVVLTLQNVSPGMVLPGRITKISEHTVTVQLSDTLAGPVPLTEMSDDYDQLNLGQYHKNDIVRVCVLDVDGPNKKLYLSMRPSKVLSSSLPVKDPQITTASQLKPGDHVRGFVKHVGDKGVIVSLSGRVDAFVRVADLSDEYVKDWRTLVQVDQLVKGRVLSVDDNGKSLLLSLKASHIERGFVPPIKIDDLTVGMMVTGKVRKVEDFGAFIDIDNTQPRLSGLCHRSEVAERRVEDVRKLYSAGDVVKAKVLKVDREARKISLGLKASYFADVEDEPDTVEEAADEVAVWRDDDSEFGGIEIDDDPQDDEGGIDVPAPDDDENEDVTGENREDVMDVDGDALVTEGPGLKTAGFDWTGEAFDQSANGAVYDSDAEATSNKKRKRHKAEIKVDLTDEIDKHGPRSDSDFERLLLGQPNDSGLWIQYMAFQLQLSEVQQARDIAGRALRTMHIRETDEKANIWIAWLNLEVEYGDNDRVEEVFKQACQVQDPLEMHEKLASIYIDSGKHDKANDIFERIVANKAFRASPEVWLNYATFLMSTLNDAARARALLPRALQSVPMNEHRLLTAKFAGLEFRFPQGDAERGRTIFEGLVTEWPKWSSGWDMWADLERSRLARVGDTDAKKEARAKVEALYERMAAQKMKKRRARFVFKQWLEFEEKEGDDKGAERVKALAKEYVESQQAKGGDEGEE